MTALFVKEKALNEKLAESQRTQKDLSNQRRKKLLADGGEPVEQAPAVLDPVQVQVAPRTAPVEARNAADTIPAPPGGTKSDNRKLALNLGVFLAKSEKLAKLDGTIAHSVELSKSVVRRNPCVETHQLYDEVRFAFSLGFEVDRSDIWVSIVIQTRLNSVFHTPFVVHGDRIGIFLGSKLQSRINNKKQDSDGNENFLHESFLLLKGVKVLSKNSGVATFCQRSYLCIQSPTVV